MYLINLFNNAFKDKESLTLKQLKVDNTEKEERTLKRLASVSIYRLFKKSWGFDYSYPLFLSYQTLSAHFHFVSLFAVLRFLSLNLLFTRQSIWKLWTFCFCFVEDADQRFGNLETRTGHVEDRVHSLEGNFEIRH